MYGPCYVVDFRCAGLALAGGKIEKKKERKEKSPRSPFGSCHLYRAGCFEPCKKNKEGKREEKVV